MAQAKSEILYKVTLIKSDGAAAGIFMHKTDRGVKVAVDKAISQAKNVRKVSQVDIIGVNTEVIQDTEVIP